jgi:hypothetical protein
MAGARCAAIEAYFFFFLPCLMALWDEMRIAGIQMKRAIPTITRIMMVSLLINMVVVYRTKGKNFF